MLYFVISLLPAYIQISNEHDILTTTKKIFQEKLANVIYNINFRVCLSIDFLGYQSRTICTI